MVSQTKSERPSIDAIGRWNVARWALIAEAEWEYAARAGRQRRLLQIQFLPYGVAQLLRTACLWMHMPQ